MFPGDDIAVKTLIHQSRHLEIGPSLHMGTLPRAHNMYIHLKYFYPSQAGLPIRVYGIVKYSVIISIIILHVLSVELRNGMQHDNWLWWA